MVNKLKQGVEETTVDDLRMEAPLLDLKARYKTIQTEIRAVIDEVCESQQFVLSQKTVILKSPCSLELE